MLSVATPVGFTTAHDLGRPRAQPVGNSGSCWGSLAGRTVLLAHGDQVRVTDPERSYAYALRARQVSDQVCRFDVPGDGHSMLRRRRDWNLLVTSVLSRRSTVVSERRP
ncbi:MAG: hypothetical protein QOD82_3357 [Pseudonocardiales bacterium]|nr:hypothetical protein [Pseudonocardiales bacterium]